MNQGIVCSREGCPKYARVVLHDGAARCWECAGHAKIAHRLTDEDHNPFLSTPLLGGGWTVHQRERRRTKRARRK